MGATNSTAAWGIQAVRTDVTPYPRPLSRPRGEDGFGGDAMPDGVGVNVAIMQVGNPFIPVIMRPCARASWVAAGRGGDW